MLIYILVQVHTLNLGRRRSRFESVELAAWKQRTKPDEKFNLGPNHRVNQPITNAANRVIETIEEGDSDNESNEEVPAITVPAVTKVPDVTKPASVQQNGVEPKICKPEPILEDSCDACKL